jgi:crotonobetainyl-CoA:carnitine CoA-transferase CaiB-like acyl-CoA transferase
MATVLDGIRVLEVADWGFVPSAGTVLGDWGAEVIKVEHPRLGDPIRGLITGGVIPGASGRNFIIEQIGRQKRSVGIDLAADAGRDLVYRLVERSDVFLTNFLPDARERLRITFDDLRRVNPRLVYARGHGQGTRGPDARRGGYDGVSFWARGGIADRLSTPGAPPVQQRPAFGDFIGGMALAGGVAGALFRRERTGEGIEVDVSLLGTALWVLSPDITAALLYGAMLPSSGEMRMTPNPLVGNYPCRDGGSIVLMMLQAERFWPHFAETIGRPDLLERYPTAEARQTHRQEIAEELARHFATRTRAEWAAVLRASDCIWGPFQSPLDLPDDPQVQANGYLLESPSPEGPVRVCANPVQFDGAPPAPGSPGRAPGTVVVVGPTPASGRPAGGSPAGAPGAGSPGPRGSSQPVSAIAATNTRARPVERIGTRLVMLRSSFARDVRGIGAR